MRLVVDASVAVKWLVNEDDSVAADRLLTADYALYAPRLLVSEVGNALWRKVRAGELKPGEVGAMAAAIVEMPLRWAADETICADAARIAVALDRSIYDCLYLALAHRLAGTLVTADRRFSNALAVTEHSHAVVLLADLAHEPD